MISKYRVARRAGLTAIATLLAAGLLASLGSGKSYIVPGTAHAQDRQAGAGQPPIVLTLMTSGLTQPVFLTHAGDDSGRLFIVERRGVVRIFQNGALLASPFLDIEDHVLSGDCSECGLLSIAFPPDFEQSGVFYASYTANNDPVDPVDPNEPDGINDTVISRFSLTSDPNKADPESEQFVLLVNQPDVNHNGGLITFGPDGYFYLGLGDGGGANDPRDIARNPASLLGKLLRLEVSATGTYTVPVDNPFVDQAGYRPEIWAMGLRNPWRYSFDRLTGDLYIGDVGQNAIEEIDYQPAGDPGGQDYGWDVMEGFSCFDDPKEANDGAGCDQNGLTLPIHDYSHALGQAVTGGYVYRGPYANLRGVYVYADFVSGRIWGLRRPATQWVNEQFLDTNMLISSFGEDKAGNLYVLDYAGAFYRIDGPQVTSVKSYIPLLFRN